MYEASAVSLGGAMRLGLGGPRSRRILPRGGGAGLHGGGQRAGSGGASARGHKGSPQDRSLRETASDSASSAPEDWQHDECFAYFNPISTAGLQHWLGSWNEALLVASERLIVDQGFSR